MSGVAVREADAAATEGARRDRRLLVVGILVMVNVMWAGQFTAIKYVESSLGPFAIAFLPYVLATPLMLPLLARKRAVAAVRPNAADWAKFTIAGLFGQVVCMAGMTWAGVVGQASNCSILYLLIPVLSAIMASIMLGERLTPLRLLALGVGLVGVLVLSAHDLHDTAFLESRFMKGNLLMLVGCLGACFYNVYCKRLMTSFDELDVLTYTYITTTPIGLLIVAVMEPDAFARLASLDTRGWLAFAFLAIVVLGVSMIMFFSVLKSLPVTVALASTYMTPVFGVVLAMLLLGERLTGTTIAGAMLVLAATALVMKYDVAHDPPPPGIPDGASASGG
jgi:drug/metabolite transporter (DMT)-like permease